MAEFNHTELTIPVCNTNSNEVPVLVKLSGNISKEGTYNIFIWFAHFIGNGKPRNLLVTGPKTNSGQMEVDDIFSFDFFINCLKVYKGCHLYRQAMKLVYNLMEGSICRETYSSLRLPVQTTTFYNVEYSLWLWDIGKKATEDNIFKLAQGPTSAKYGHNKDQHLQYM